MSYSICVHLHGYCSSFIIILLISSLFDSHLNSLSFHHSSLLQSRSASPSSSKSQASKTKTTIARRRSRAPRTESDRRVWAASELGTLISLSDPTICLEMETLTENWSNMEGKTRYYLDSSSTSSGAMGFLCGAKVSNSRATEDRDDESRWWWGLGVSIFCGVWNFCLDFLWGDGGWWWWLGGCWLPVGDFGFVLGLWEGSREEEGEANNKKCKMNEYFIE